MRPLSSISRFRSIGLAASLVAGLASNAVAATSPCMRPAEKVAFDLAGLKSQLMVTAISCQAEEQYNSFIARFRSDLQGGEKALNSYFNRAAGNRAQQAHDDYITSLANTQSESGLQQGVDFCGKHLSMFSDVMALKDSKDLTAYAAGQPIVQAIDVVECPPPPAKKTKTASGSATPAK